jgi:hypothetical protein
VIRLLGALLALVVVAALLVWLYTQGDPGATPEPVEPPAANAAPAPDPTFDHDLHAEEVADCAACHHDLTSNAVEPEPCLACHPVRAATGPPAAGCEECHDAGIEEVEVGHADLVVLHPDCKMCHVPRTAEAAYRDQCLACHAEEDVETARTGPG